MRLPARTLIVSTLLAGSLAVGGAALARPPGGPGDCGGIPHAGMRAGHGDPAARLERMADRLGLTQQQRDSVRGIVDRYRPQTRQLSDRMRDNRQQLRTAMREAQPDAAQVQKLAQAQGDLVAERIVLHSKMRAEIDQVLTPEQRQQLQNRRGPGAGAKG